MPLYERYPDMEIPVITIEGREYIGYLYVPDLELSLPVISDWSYDNLKKAPCRYNGCIYSKDMIIAGHNYRSHFSNLKRLPLGSEIQFVDMDGNQFFYNIVEVQVLDQMAVEDMEAGNWDMTLFTCNYGGRGRVTMRCELTKSIPNE